MRKPMMMPLWAPMTNGGRIFLRIGAGDLWESRTFDVLGEMVQKAEMKDKLLISSDLNNYKRWIGGYIDLGFEKILLHNVNREQENFIEVFGDQVLPAFR